MRAMVKYIVGATYKPLLVKYLSKTRSYTCKGIRLEIPPEVFHPGYFHSTGLLLRQLSGELLAKKRFLELGAGSGLLSIYAAQKGAYVTASDINPVSVECVRSNAENNGVALNILLSDLFDRIPRSERFDFIVINPPYYKGKPASFSEYAWYCGENGEYFQKLFRDLGSYMHDQTSALMVLCEGCDLQMITNMAAEHSFRLQCVVTRQGFLEKNFIFKLQRIE